MLTSGEVRWLSGKVAIHPVTTARGWTTRPTTGSTCSVVNPMRSRGERFLPFDYAPVDNQNAVGLIVSDGLVTDELALCVQRYGAP